ncbi:hypothetical protein BC938DRAFT_475445 [Jimgerdemannia flammicorona]|uniref:Zn(2)-C6 fungal-type domain-containing protein n=1 Tax=Jimgerdemannia flammicorona TaxID=994334 RepID=A0A433PUS6_9FUNG|nr:hypothetical protein BC938DRAFT_475445 [Jimgerdemannia flammicorona]
MMMAWCACPGCIRAGGGLPFPGIFSSDNLHQGTRSAVSAGLSNSYNPFNPSPSRPLPAAPVSSLTSVNYNQPNPYESALMTMYEPEGEDFRSYTRAARQIPVSAISQHHHHHHHHHQHQHQHQQHQHQHQQQQQQQQHQQHQHQQHQHHQQQQQQHHQQQHQHQHHQHHQNDVDRNMHQSSANTNTNNRFATNMDQPLPLPLPMPNVQFGGRSLKPNILGDQDLMQPSSVYGVVQQPPTFSAQNALSNQIKEENALTQSYQEALMGKRIMPPTTMAVNMNHTDWSQQDPKRAKRDSMPQELLPRPPNSLSTTSEHHLPVGTSSPITSGGDQTETSRPKVYVLKACVSCKASHVACDIGRPCQRCVRLNKADTCVDAERKKRGRPCNSTKKGASGPTGPPSNTVPNGRPSSPRQLNPQHEHDHVHEFYLQKKRPIMPQVLAPIINGNYPLTGLPNYAPSNMDPSVAGGLYSLAKQSSGTVSLPQISHPLPPLSPEASPQQTPSVIQNVNGNVLMNGSNMGNHKNQSNAMNPSSHTTDYSPDIVEIATALLLSSRGGDASSQK